MHLSQRIKKFLIVGFSAALVNLLFMTFFVEIMGFKSFYLKNLANILAIEISILYNFVLSRRWTWSDAPLKQGKVLLAQVGSFHVAALMGIVLRVILFAAMEKWGLFYLVNVAFGIGVAAVINFFIYDKFVFKREVAYEGKSL